MNGKRNYQLVVVFLILQIIIYLSINNVKAASSLMVIENVPYPFYQAMTTSLYQVDGAVGFSVNPSKTPPLAGPVSSQAFSNDVSLIKSLYYGYSNPGNVFSELPKDLQITYTHLLASYIYAKDMNGFTFYTLKNYFNCNLIDYFNQLPYLKDPNHYELSFTESQLVFSNDGKIQRSNSIRLIAPSGTGGYFDLPEGLALINETSNTTTTAQRCYVQADDRFHFEAGADYLKESLALTFNLNLNVFNYKVKLSKVQGTVDLANPANDAYQAIASLIKVPGNVETSINLDFQFKPKITVVTKSDTGEMVANQKVVVTGPDLFASQSYTDENGQLRLTNLNPGTYYVKPVAVDFPYKENGEIYSVTVNYREIQNITIILHQITQATAIYRLNGAEQPLFKEEFSLLEDYQAKGFNHFELDKYEPQSVAIVKDNQLYLKTTDPIDFANGLNISRSWFQEYLTLTNDAYSLEINLEAILKVPDAPIFSGRNGIIEATKVSESNLQELVFMATRINCLYQASDVTKQLKIENLNIENFNKPGIAVVQFDFSTPEGLNFKTSYNILVVAQGERNSASGIRFVDQVNLSGLTQGYYANNLVANEFLQESLAKTGSLITYTLSADDLRQIKTDYQTATNFDMFNNSVISNSVVSNYQEITSALVTAKLDDNQEVVVYKMEEAVAQEDRYVNTVKYYNGQIKSLVNIKGNYLGALRFDFELNKIDITQAQWAAMGTRMFEGKPHYPEPDLYLQNEKMLINRDYQLTYENNIGVGEATITVIGINRYQGEFTINFQIQGE